jgi:hypothetical protein
MRILFIAVTGAVETAPQHVEVLRTHHPVPMESDSSDFHELRRGFIPPKPARTEHP